MFTHHKTRNIACMAILASAACIATANAAETHHVDVGPGLDFIPANITIATGEWIQWAPWKDSAPGPS